MKFSPNLQFFFLMSSLISKTMKEKLKTLWIKSFESNNLTVYKLQTNFIICILQHIYLGTSTNNSLGEQSSVIFNILFGNCEGSNCRHFDVEIIWNFIHFYQYPSSLAATQQSTPTVFVLVFTWYSFSVAKFGLYLPGDGAIRLLLPWYSLLYTSAKIYTKLEKCRKRSFHFSQRKIERKLHK